MSLADDFEKHANEEKARLAKKQQQEAENQAKKDAERAKLEAKQAHDDALRAQ